MKILVDKMAKEPYECPYYIDRSTMDNNEYVCGTKRVHRRCYCTENCPFFTEYNNDKKD
jgi:hypothetical protein